MTKVMLLGAGRWGKNYIKTINGLDNIEISYIFDNRTLIDVHEEIDDIIKEGVKIISDFPEDNRNIDVAIVATPTSTHLEYISRLIKIDVKNIICEKPMCLSIPEANFIKGYAKEMGINLFVGHTYLANPIFREFKKLLKNKEIGNVKYISSERLNFGPIRNDMNAVQDLVVHDISMFNFIYGEPDKINAVGYDVAERGVADIVETRLSYGDIDVNIKAGWLYPYKSRKIIVVGDNGIIEFDELSRTPLIVYRALLKKDESGNYFGSNNAKYIMAIGDDRSPLEVQVSEFIEKPSSNIDFSFDVIKTIDMINRKIKGGE